MHRRTALASLIGALFALALPKPKPNVNITSIDHDPNLVIWTEGNQIYVKNTSDKPIKFQARVSFPASGNASS